MAMSVSGKFTHNDIVKVIKTGQTGMIKKTSRSGNQYIYGLQLDKDAATTIDAPEEELELVKSTNADETGFALFPTRKIM